MKTLCNCVLIAILVATTADLAVAQGKKGAGAAAAPPSSAARLRRQPHRQVPPSNLR